MSSPEILPSLYLDEIANKVENIDGQNYVLTSIASITEPQLLIVA
jgi:hypothetical protein